MRFVLGTFSIVVIAACGSPPPPSPVVQGSASSASTAAAPPGKPVADAPSPEVAALRKCDASDPELTRALEVAKKQAAKGPIADRAVVDAVWSCFDRIVHPMQAPSEVIGPLGAAVRAIKDASYGPKALEKLAIPVNDPKDPIEGRDQLGFWQPNSAYVVGETRYSAGVRPLVKILLDDKKQDLEYVAGDTLAKMPKDAEPVLIAAIAGTDPELAQLASKSANQAWLARCADALAAIGRDAGRDAIVQALPKAANDESRALLAMTLVRFAQTPAATKAFLDAYAKIGPKTTLERYAGTNARSLLAGAAPAFFDPALGDWVLKEGSLDGAIKLMTTASAKNVGAAVNKLPGDAVEKAMYKHAVAVLDACKKDVACYLKELAKPTPADRTSPARMAHVKAAWMAGVHGDASTRTALVDRLVGLKNAEIRRAVLVAIEHLSPKGDAQTADRLEAITKEEGASELAIDETRDLVLRLRARAL
jgi:hypothetical protein